MYFPGDPLLDYDPMYIEHSRRARAQAPRLGVRLGDDDSRAGARLPVRHRAARPRRDADGELRCRRAAMSLQTTASQTVGPYLHIGLTWLVTDNLVAPGRDRRSDHDRRPHHRRRRRARERCAGRDLAGQLATAATRIRKTRGDRAARARVEGLRPRAHRCRRALPLHDDQARPRARAGRRTAGAAHQRHDLHARHAAASRHAHLLSRRSGQRRGCGAAERARRAARHAHRAAPIPAKPTALDGTCACRATARR